jgi:Amidohydrolase family
VSTTAVPRAHLTVVRGARLFDGAEVAAFAAPTVVIDGNRILAVGDAVPMPEHAMLVDLPGATLLPGLVDTHVHLALDASTDPVGRLAGRDDAALLAAMADAARTAAWAGVTTVRDLGDRDFLSLDLRASADPTLPTIVASGPPLTTPAGHCHFLGGATADIRAAVHAHAERGVDVIKVMASGGNLTPGSRPELPQFEPDELRTAVDEAHRHQLPITAHVHSTRAVTAAVAAGVDGLEHMTFMTADGVDPVPADLLTEIVARQVGSERHRPFRVPVRTAVRGAGPGSGHRSVAFRRSMGTKKRNRVRLPGRGSAHGRAGGHRSDRDARPPGTDARRFYDRVPTGRSPLHEPQGADHLDRTRHALRGCRRRRRDEWCRMTLRARDIST